MSVALTQFYSPKQWNDWVMAIGRLVRGEGTDADAKLVDKRAQQDGRFEAEESFREKRAQVLASYGLTPESVRQALDVLQDWDS